MKKTLVLVVGASGSGKTNLIDRTFKSNQILRSTTTRPMRPDEQQGINYLFTDNNTFENMLAANQLVQYAQYDNNYYGVTKKEINDKLTNDNKIVVVAVVMPTVKDFQAYCHEENIRCITVFCDISKERLLSHFANRTESDSQKQHRIKKYEAEMLNKKYFSKSHILNMNPDDFGVAASKQLISLIYQ